MKKNIYEKSQKLPADFVIPYIIGNEMKVDTDTLKKWVQYKEYIVATEKFFYTRPVICTWVAGEPKSAIQVIYPDRGIDVSEVVIPILPTIDEPGIIILKGEIVDKMKSKNPLDFSIFFNEIIECPVNIKEYYERLIYIRMLGLKTPEFMLFSSVDDFILPIVTLLNRDNTHRVEGVILNKNLGMRENTAALRDRITYNISSETVKVTIKNIEWRITREGRLHPIVVMSLVGRPSADIYVESTSLDTEVITSRCLGVGALLDIIKIGNDVHIMSIIESSNVSIPEKCPSCYKKLVKRTGDLYCESINCVDIGIKKIMYFLKKLGLKHVPESTIKRINPFTIEDVYDHFTSLTRCYASPYSRPLYNKIRRKIYNIIKTRPAKLLLALGIKGVNEKIASEIIANVKGDFSKLFTITKPEDVGIKQKNVAESFITKIGSYKELYNFLLGKGLMFTAPVDQIFSGIRFTLDGHMGRDRNTVMEEIEYYGGYVGPLSEKTDYLITYYGDEGTRWPSSKVSKARLIHTPIIAWSKYTDMLSGKMKPQKRPV